MSLPSVQIRESFVTIPVAARINATSVGDILKADRARARFLAQKAREKAVKVQAGTFSADAVADVPATTIGLSYVVSAGVGTPPTQYSLIVDTGSANTWVGADKKFIKTSSTEDTHNKVSKQYGTGSFSGIEVNDTVTLADDLVIVKQGVGVAQEHKGFTGVDGILGLGPTGLTVDTLDPDSKSLIPTVIDNLFAQKSIPADLFGVSFEPTGSAPVPVANGHITFGGIDSSKFTGSITYVPITSKGSFKDHWGIDQSIKYQGNDILKDGAGLVDTGVTFTLLRTGVFTKYLKHTGGVMDENTEPAGMVRLTKEQFAKLQNLDFEIGGTTFSLTPHAQTWPRALNGLIKGDPDAIYLCVADLDDDDEGFDFVNGQTFLQRFYAVYDTTNKRIGIATTPFTNATD